MSPLRKHRLCRPFLSQHNPFGTVASLGAAERERAGNQSVCSLRTFLELAAARRDTLVIFDLYRPPRGHPYRDSWIQRTLEVIHNESSIRSQQVRGGERNKITFKTSKKCKDKVREATRGM